MSDDIHEVVRQWRTKAQSDWTTVQILLGSCECPADTACFHCQQFVEKLLKAVLTRYGVEAPRTHDLRRLIQLAEPHVPELSQFSEASDLLTVHGVEARYPGDLQQITSEQMNQAAELAKKIGEILLSKVDV